MSFDLGDLSRVDRRSYAQRLKKVAIIDLPGPNGRRFDYLTTDNDHHFLLSAHLGPGILYVIDLQTVKAIPGVPGITGLEYVPGLQEVYTSDWGENKIGVVDLQSMSVAKRLPTAAKPNGSVYAAPFRKLCVSDTDGLAEAIVDVDKDFIVKTLHQGHRAFPATRRGRRGQIRPTFSSSLRPSRNSGGDLQGHHDDA